MIRRPPRSTLSSSSAASDVYKRQVSYNADVPTNARLAYIGQDLFASGQAMGKKIAAALPAGSRAAIFIATPGSLNIQPRADGAVSAIKASGKNINVKQVATGADQR